MGGSLTLAGKELWAGWLPGVPAALMGAVCSRIIATPGRLMHVAVEMNLKLQSVEYVVFDEADRSVSCHSSKGEIFLSGVS